jgi:hypothetical protein
MMGENVRDSGGIRTDTGRELHPDHALKPATGGACVLEDEEEEEKEEEEDEEGEDWSA